MIAPPVRHQRLSTLSLGLLLALALSMLAACSAEPRKTDAELGLNPQQAAGRRVFDRHCAQCHFAYISRSLRGPSLQGLYKKQFMSSGIPSNDDRIRDIVVYGRAKMPAFGRDLNPQQVDDLIAYLHTL